MNQNKSLLSHLNKFHLQANAKMTIQAGWSMPMTFTDVMQEYDAVTNRAGIFDLSNLGRIRVRGAGALDLLERACTADVARQEDDTTIETLLLNEKAGIIDHCLLTRLDNMWVLTTSAITREKVLQHLKSLDIPGAKIDDQTTKVGQVSATGPNAKAILDTVLPHKVSELNLGEAKMGSMFIARYIATCSSIRDIWSLDVMLPNMLIGKAWSYITQKAGSNSITPVGNACREILRIEAGKPRYGHEISEIINPQQAGLLNLVKMDHDFLGAEALTKIIEKSPARKRVMLTFEALPTTAVLPRLGDPIFTSDLGEVGNITSSTLSPQHGEVIAMGYVSSDFAKNNQHLTVNSANPINMHVSKIFEAQLA